MAAHNDLGHKGEDMAAKYLQEQGYFILERNWMNKGRKELDIIATKDDIIVFVEVKTRKVGSVTTPISAVDDRKQHRYREPGCHQLRYGFVRILERLAEIAVKRICQPVSVADDDRFVETVFLPEIFNSRRRRVDAQFGQCRVSGDDTECSEGQQ